jgi:glycosyltransferase involved in cell wall biosynthesis
MTAVPAICFVMPYLTKSAEDPLEIIKRCDKLATKFQASFPSTKASAFFLSSGFSTEQLVEGSFGKALTLHIFSGKKINPIKFAFRAYGILKQVHDQKITLISGDNYFALVICIILKIFINSDSKIQISIHGNPLSGSVFIPKNLIRKIAFRFFIPQATSIRLVSEHLRSELGHYFSKNAEVLISPIPINMRVSFEKDLVELRIGFIGRLHHERGVILFCDILGELANSRDYQHFLVIGDGPEKHLIENFRESNPDYPLEVAGLLSHQEVMQSFKSINILLNCSPNEGYGLAMREAIVTGSYVVALNNAGTRELKRLFPKVVYLFDKVEEAVALVRSLSGKVPDKETVMEYRLIQSDLDQSGTSLLVKSWL